MAKQNERIALDRGGERQRRLKWWMVPAVLLVLGVLIGGGWLFRPRIERLFEAEATLPPPPPTRTPSAAGESGGEEAAPASDGTLYAVDFDTPPYDEWETGSDGVLTAEMRDGMLVYAVHAVVDEGGWSGLNFTFEDFVLDVDATKLAGPDDNGIIVVFRLTDEENYNRFDISSDGYYALSIVRDGLPRAISDWAASDAIQQGEATNHLTVTAIGETFSFAVNGQTLRLCVSDDPDSRPVPMPDECLGGEYVDAWTNGDLARGKIGLGAQGFVGFDGEESTLAEATIGFDNVVIGEP